LALSAIISLVRAVQAQESPSPSPPPAGLSASPQAVNDTPGLPVAVAISGAREPLQVSLDDKIAAVSTSGTTITLTGGNRPGRTTMHVLDATGAQLDLPVRIAFNAGTVPKVLTLKLTGDPDGAFAAAQAQLAVARATQGQPGTTPQFGPVAVPGQQLRPNDAAVLSVPVRIAGGDEYFDVNDTTQVTLQYASSAPFEPQILYYSDDPERIDADGVLYRATLTPSQPVRLYDYHENGDQPRRLVIAMRASAPSSLQIVESFHGPNIDVMTVGHSVTREFLAVKPGNKGLVVDLSAGVTYVHRDVAMAGGQGIASNIDFNLLSGGPVSVVVAALPPEASAQEAFALPAAPLDGKNRHGIFDLRRYGALSATYVAGGPDQALSVGDREPSVPKASSGDGADYGDYGVLFRLRFAFSNPTDSTQTAYLYETPRGGPARAAYLVDNDPAQLKELGCATSVRTPTDAPHRYLIAAYELPARSNQTHTLLTMTDGGSNLPLEIGVTGVPPELNAPPIGSPEGCFPKPG